MIPGLEIILLCLGLKLMQVPLLAIMGAWSMVVMLWQLIEYY